MVGQSSSSMWGPLPILISSKGKGSTRMGFVSFLIVKEGLGFSSSYNRQSIGCVAASNVFMGDKVETADGHFCRWQR
jgi:hypothetical protein